MPTHTSGRTLQAYGTVARSLRSENETADRNNGRPSSNSDAPTTSTWLGKETRAPEVKTRNEDWLIIDIGMAGCRKNGERRKAKRVWEQGVSRPAKVWIV